MTRMNLGLELSIGVDGEKPAAGFSPLDIPSLQVYLDASDDTTITLNGADVSYWDDKSGNNRDVRQTSGGAQPLYSIGAQNGLNGICFNGSSEFLQNTMSMGLSNSSYTVFVVGKAAGPDQVFFGWTQNQGFFVQSASTNEANITQVDTYGPADILTTTGGAAPYNTSAVLAFTRSAVKAFKTYVDGVLRGSLAGQTNATSIGQWALGRLSPTVAALYLNGFIFEFLLYSRNLLTSEREQVENHLLGKWGI